MKAKEYFEKYASRLMGDDVDVSDIDLTSADGKDAAKRRIEDKIGEAANELFMEFINESKALIDKRKCKSNSAVAGIIKELNDKWNAMIPLFEKKYEFSPLKRNAVNRFWVKRIPGLKEYLRGAISE